MHARLPFLLLRRWPPFPCAKIAFLSVSVAAEVIPARWPAVIFRALLRHCCACLLAVSDSVAAVYLDRASTCPCCATLRDCASGRSSIDTASEPVPALLVPLLKSAVGVELTLSNVAFLVPAALESRACAAGVPPPLLRRRLSVSVAAQAIPTRWPAVVDPALL